MSIAHLSTQGSRVAPRLSLTGTPPSSPRDVHARAASQRQPTALRPPPLHRRAHGAPLTMHLSVAEGLVSSVGVDGRWRLPVRSLRGSSAYIFARRHAVLWPHYAACGHVGMKMGGAQQASIFSAAPVCALGALRRGVGDFWSVPSRTCALPATRASSSTSRLLGVRGEGMPVWSSAMVCLYQQPGKEGDNSRDLAKTCGWTPPDATGHAGMARHATWSRSSARPARGSLPNTSLCNARLHLSLCPEAHAAVVGQPGYVHGCRCRVRT